MGDATTTSASGSKFFKLNICAFEFHGIIVKSLPENRKFDTIKMFKVSRELIYLRPKGVSIPEDHRLLLRGPKVAIFGSEETAIIIGNEKWEWRAGFDRYKFRCDGIRFFEVKDPEFPEACVQIICEKISKPAQAHFRIIFEDQLKDREISIVRGEIAAISDYNKDTKRLLRCFGEDLNKNLRPSENPESKLKRSKPLPCRLVSKKAIDLYRSQLVLRANSELIIDLNLELELVNGDSTRSFFSFMTTAPFRAPADPDWVQNKDFIPHALEDRKETVNLPIDEFANIRVEVSWFNDLSPYVLMDSTLWGYRDGDCDYEGIDWVDRQEVKADEEINS